MDESSGKSFSIETTAEISNQCKTSKLSRFRAAVRATRLFSIVDSSNDEPAAALLKFRLKHRADEQISDELLDKIPFKIEIVPDRREESKREENKKPEPPNPIGTFLSDEDRMRIIDEVLQDLSQRNIFDEVRQANRVAFRLTRNNQTQKNVADRLVELTGSDTAMLNDPLYMEMLCDKIAEKHQNIDQSTLLNALFQ